MRWSTCSVKVPTPGPYSTNNLQFAQSTGREHLVDHRLGRGNDRADHHRMLDEALEEVPERAAARAAREPAVSPYFVPGCRHDVSNSLGKDRCVGKSGRAWQAASGRAPLRRPARARPEKGRRDERLRAFPRAIRLALLGDAGRRGGQYRDAVAAAGDRPRASASPTSGWRSRSACRPLLWVAMAPVWAHRADRRGRRALMRLGLIGFIVSMLICGGALAAGLAGLAGGMTVFVDLHVRPQRLRRVRLGLAARGPGLYRGAHRRARSGPARSPLSPPPSASARSSARRSRPCSSSRRSASPRR